MTEIDEAPELPSVVIVGRPNVGKSTLFNRIVGEQVAIVEDRPGVTRDRKEVDAEWLGRPFKLVDTGGWLPSGSELDDKVSRQVEAAVRRASLVMFLVDGSVGVTDDDEQIAIWLRRIKPPVLLVVNKADNDQREGARWEFLSLGLGEPLPVSALHGRRAGDLLDEVIARIPDVSPAGIVEAFLEDDENWTPPEQAAPRVAVVGRPNVGKSTLFNRLVGENRSVVHDMPGTTRDAIDTLVRALRAIDDADIALFVIDATEGITGQDQRLAERVDAAGCPIVLLLNKWELIDDAERRLDILAEVKRKLGFIGDAPILKISALSGKGVNKLAPVLKEAIVQYHRRVPTRDVNKVISAAQQKQPAPGGTKVLYAMQGATDPPTFTLFVNRELPHTYLRYLERSIREAFDFGSTPLKLRVRRRTE